MTRSSHVSFWSLAAAITMVVAACATLHTRGEGPNPEDAAPAFSLSSSEGGQVALAELLAEGPAVVVFYRGHW